MRRDVRRDVCNCLTSTLARDERVSNSAGRALKREVAT